MTGTVRWPEFWKLPKSRIYFSVGIGCMVLMFITVFFTLRFVEQRPGFIIETWAKELLGSPINFSIGIFGITYFSIVFAISEHARRPVTFLQMLIAYSFMQISKCVLLLLVPLDPPVDILPLSDPILENAFYGGNVNLKDLFFSGHVATVFIAGVFTRTRTMKFVFLLLGIALSFMLAQQRVHYIADVIAAPFFAWLAFKASSPVSRSLS